MYEIQLSVVVAQDLRQSACKGKGFFLVHVQIVASMVSQPCSVCKHTVRNGAGIRQGVPARCTRAWE